MQPDLISYNTLLKELVLLQEIPRKDCRGVQGHPICQAYATARDSEGAQRILAAMRRERVLPDIASFASAMQATKQKRS